MRLLLLCALGVVVVGCDSGKAEVNEPKPPPTQVVEKEPAPPATVKPSLAKYPDRINALEDLPEGVVEVAGKQYKVWIADNDSSRTEGMMYLLEEDVPDDRGMLFLFEEEREQTSTFWMRNTPLPLDIIYIGSDKRVVNVGKGEPFSEDPVPAEGSYRYVLELKQGLAAKNGIRKGSLVKLPGS